MKKILLFLIITVLSVSLVACNQEPVTQDQASTEETLAEETQVEDNSEIDLVLSTEELSNYNGKDGNPAYIAVNGIIYDVSDSNLWKEGEHNGFEAGKDLTAELMEKSPHGEKVIERLTPVGTLGD